MGSIDKMMDYAFFFFFKPRYKLGGGRIGTEASFIHLLRIAQAGSINVPRRAVLYRNPCGMGLLKIYLS